VYLVFKVQFRGWVDYNTGKSQLIDMKSLKPILGKVRGWF
jgi:hypothetical protein